MGVPQVIWLSTTLASVLVAGHLHGTPLPSDKYNFGRMFFAAAIEFALLWWGGFWN